MEITNNVKVIEIPEGKIGIWRIKESSEKLQQIFTFSEKEKIEFQCIKYENRKKEFLTVRLLLENLLGKKHEIFYTSDRRPQLKNHPFFISISHSSDLAVVIVSKRNTGIDAENFNRNTEKVATRFLSENELIDINNSPDSALQRMLYWCAKEAAFKFSVWPEIEFKSQINIDNFVLDTKGGIFTGQITKKLPATKLAFHYFFTKTM